MLKQFKTGQWHYYPKLPPHAQPIYMAIYKGILQKQTLINVPVTKHNGVFPTTKYLMNVMMMVVWDNPELYYFGAANARTNFWQGYYQSNFQISYTDYYSDHEEEQILKTLLMRTEFLLQETAGMTDYAKLRYIHDYLVRNVKYMYDLRKTNIQPTLEASTVVGPLLNNLGVCSGIAKTFKLLCDQAGLTCFYVQGDANGLGGWDLHGWNVVGLDGKYYHVDVTWDISHFHHHGVVSDRYFMRGDQFMSQTRKWDRSLFPAMPEDYVHPTVKAGSKIKRVLGKIFS